MEEGQELKDLKGIIRRRKRGFITAFFLVSVLSVVIAFALPPIYRSQATILIEGQQIPTDYVKTTITSYVEERLQMITQQIMSRTKLLEIINRFNLYAEMRDRHTIEEIIEKMREDITLETISADVRDKRTGREGSATIAFTVSYEGKNPATVQKVANVLPSLYLEENIKARERTASNTTEFLQQELDDLKEQITVNEQKITEFKEAHLGELPEHNAANMQALSRLQRDLDQTSSRLRSLEERKIYLEGQLTGIDPLRPIMSDDGKTIMNPEERLRFLRLKLISLQSTLSDKHPDIKKLKKEIQELEAKVGESDDSLYKVKKLKDLENRLVELQGRLGPRHPDVLKLSREIEALREELNVSRAKQVTREVTAQRADNPAYINLRTQIASTDMEMKSLLQERSRIKKDIDEYQRKIANAPLIEREYNELTRDYENAKFKYNEILNKLMEARVAQGMEETQRGERFTIIDPAHYPEKPYKPNRIAIILIGVVLAMGAGVGLAAARESLDPSIKTPEELQSIVGSPVLSVVSLIETDEEKRRKRIKRALQLLLVMTMAAGAMAVVHIFVMPLDILLIKIQRRVIMGLGI
jgi:uncharacterized protein involved in exopolysaccharide biosynthesis